jgi:hypothetical protein
MKWYLSLNRSILSIPQVPILPNKFVILQIRYLNMQIARIYFYETKINIDFTVCSIHRFNGTEL